MRARIASVVVVAFMLLVLVPAAWLSNKPEPAVAQNKAAAPVVNCTDIRISPRQVRIQCSMAGVVVLNTVVDLPQVEPITLPPLPGATIRLPGPTQTVTVIVPGGQQTIQIPGPTKTVTKTAKPDASPTNGPPTETVTVSTSGQEPSESATLGPHDPVVRIPDIETITEAVGLGLLATLFLMALILLAMWAGYVVGFKDKEAKETDFLRALLDAGKTGKHR